MTQFRHDITVDGKIIKVGGDGTKALMDDGSTKPFPSGSTIMRTIQISEYDLTTNDEEGVREYMLQQGIVINKGEIILIKVDKISTYMVGDYVEAGYVF